VLTVQNVSFRYDQGADKWDLKNVHLDIKEGEWVALVGHNGSGKSTLAKLLNGLLLPEQGEIVVDDTVLTEESIWEIRKHVGMVFQNPDNQFVGTTVKDDVAFGLENIGIERSEMVKRIEESLYQVRMLDYQDQDPHRLSGGQKQRVAIASVLAIRPSLLIMDESTAMLDPEGRQRVIKTVRDLQQGSKMGVVSITHELDEVLEADRVIVLNKGEIFAEGTPEEIFKLDEELVKIGLDLPFTVKLSKALRDKGISLSKNFLNHEELVEELWTFYSRM
jgi:energy-coupling factor transport system ATP-binding protein